MHDVQLNLSKLTLFKVLVIASSPSLHSGCDRIAIGQEMVREKFVLKS